MHYTSIENIHKVIDPLFLDDLKKEYEEIGGVGVLKTREQKLQGFQTKISSLHFLDPACGSGNFLTETYLSLRRLENHVIRDLIACRKGQVAGQIVFGDGGESNPIKVSISQFYGIEINDFAVTVAKTALWIAESQMMRETEAVVHMSLDFLPLKTNAYIVEGNALRMDWESVVPKNKLNYIMGNPPFVGASMMTTAQKSEAVNVFGKIKLSNSIDYVGAWYCKSAKLMSNTSILAALVSTNSITQGEQVAPLWRKLIDDYHIHIDFAYCTFRWDSEASVKAHVHCVIIGFSSAENSHAKKLYDAERMKIVENISPYLIEAPSILISSRAKPLCNVPPMFLGNKPSDGGNLILSVKEKHDVLCREPQLAKFIHPYIGAEEYINKKQRFCFWLVSATPDELRKSSELRRRLQAVREMREQSSATPTRQKSNTPQLFFFISQPKTNYILIPSTSSERRRYIPLGFLPPEIIASNSATIVPDANLNMFGIMISNVHMAWMRTVAGRLKSDYRYSNAIVYNNFPWPTPTDAQKAKIEQTAQSILDARALYPESSLADLYDELSMPPELRTAHRENDRAVMQAYGFSVKDMTESKCVAELMKMYQKLVERQEKEETVAMA